MDSHSVRLDEKMAELYTPKVLRLAAWWAGQLAQMRASLMASRIGLIRVDHNNRFLKVRRKDTVERRCNHCPRNEKNGFWLTTEGFFIGDVSNHNETGAPCISSRRIIGKST